MSNGNPNTITADIVVVGAGMAGLYFAWRMLKQNPGTKIVIVEKLARSGGRLDTDVEYINGQPVKNEEGGMRFTLQMSNLWWLLNAVYKLFDIMPFRMGDDNNIYNLRGKAFTFGQARTDPSIWSTIYNLAPNEQNKQPNVILQGVLQSILTTNNFAPPKTPEDWQQFRLQCTYRGIPLYQWGFWALLRDYGLSQECMQMVEDCMGFLAFYRQEVNAGVGFQTMGDFDDLPPYMTLRPGYETLPTSLQKAIEGMGGQFYFNTHVDTVTTNSAADPVSVSASQGIVFVAPQVVLALPSLPLQALATRSGLMTGQLMADLDSVTSMPLTKINLYFNERWWYNLYQVATGGSFTDLPMAQFYCYDPIDQNATGPASMTIYCDYDRTGYWDTLQQIGTPFPVTAPWTQPPNSTPASTFVVEEAMRELATFFNNTALPQPQLSTYVGWGTGDIGDGDHSWKVGVNDQEVMQRLQALWPGKLYTCGEAYSDEQAWVDGALRSTETLLQQQFGLPPYHQDA